MATVKSKKADISNSLQRPIYIFNSDVNTKLPNKWKVANALRPDMRQWRYKWCIKAQTENLFMLGNHNKQFKGNSFILVDWATSTPWKALHSWMKQMFHTIAFKSILFVAISQEKEVFAGNCIIFGEAHGGI